MQIHIHHIRFCMLLCPLLFCWQQGLAQPNWPAIRNNATFIVHDTSYMAPYIQPFHVGGWEDGLFMTRDGRHLYSTYMPLDVLSWLNNFAPCLDFTPYFRPPLLDIDTVTNPFGCPNFIHSDIVYTSRADTSLPFAGWGSSSLAFPSTFEGGAHGVLLDESTFDVFVFTRDQGAPWGMEIMMLQNVPINPSGAEAVAIVSSEGQEDNPHIERLNANTLLLFFDRDRYLHYSLSYDNGLNWEPSVMVTSVLNDQAPYDVQPHLWHDGSDWWMYFCADNEMNTRCIYKSRQQVSGDWDSWAPKEIVLEPTGVTGMPGVITGIGEPTLTAWGDLSFVVVYGDGLSADSTDVFDCDPWYLPRQPGALVSVGLNPVLNAIKVYPNPARDRVRLENLTPGGLLWIWDVSGRMIHHEQVNAMAHELSTAGWGRGLYFMVLETTHSRQTARLMVD